VTYHFLVVPPLCLGETAGLCIAQLLDYASDVFQLVLGIGLRHQEHSCIQDLLFDFIVVAKGVDEVLNRVLEFFSRAVEVCLLEGEDKLEARRLREGAIMEVSIGENTMKSIAVTVTWLVEKRDGSEGTTGVPELGFEDVGDFSF
jgi:hypothetical protein